MAIKKLFLLKICLFFIFNLPVLVYSQSDYPFEIDFYNFINYSENKLVFPGDSSDFEHVFYKLDTVILNGKGKISVVHIGGSHIQADVYSGRTRERLQTFYPGMNGGRGSVFPYRISKTNNPRSYSVYYSGIWQSCRNVENKKKCNLGLTGMSVTTFDVNANFEIKLKSDSLVNYTFNKIKLFHEIDSTSFIPVFGSEIIIKKIERNQELGYTLFYLGGDYDEFKLSFKSTSSAQNNFTIFGISLDNDDSGIVYHSIGVNGASFPSFLKCDMFEKHLKALNPDVIIISLGTNDAYTTKFNPDFYQLNYEELVDKIRKILPKVAILNTVANDSYLFRRYPNKNTELAAEVIYKVAKKKNCGVYDFYKVMGGFNSSSLWFQKNLMVKDKIHFNKQGYLLVGDLFFNAIIKSYDNHIKNASY